MYKVYKASVLTIRSPKAKRTHSDKKGKDPVEIDGRILEYYMCKQCFVIQIGIQVEDSGLCGLTNRLLITNVWDECARRRSG